MRSSMTRRATVYACRDSGLWSLVHVGSALSNCQREEFRQRMTSTLLHSRELIPPSCKAQLDYSTSRLYRVFPSLGADDVMMTEVPALQQCFPFRCK